MGDIALDEEDLRVFKASQDVDTEQHANHTNSGMSYQEEKAHFSVELVILIKLFKMIYEISLHSLQLVIPLPMTELQTV